MTKQVRADTPPDAGLIEIRLPDGRRYLGIPEEHADEVAKAIQERVTRIASRVGADPGSVPLLALSMQLTVAAKRDDGFGAGTSLDGIDGDRRLSVHEVAKHHDITTGAVRKAARQGRLRGDHLNGGDGPWMFRPADVDAFTPRKAVSQ